MLGRIISTNSSDQIQACSESLEDIENTCVAPGHEVELTELEYSIMGQVYLDPVAIYMEKLFITKPRCIPIIFVACQVYQAPYDEDQDGNIYYISLTVLFLSWVKNSERAKVSDPIFDWLY